MKRKPPLKYRATPVPRFLRVSRLAYLPTTSVIGSQTVPGENGANLIFDIIMLPLEEFQRMRSNIGLQVMPVSSVNEIRELVVPPEERDAEAFARNHFQLEFGLKEPPPAPFPDVAGECTRRDRLLHARELAEGTVDRAEHGQHDPGQKRADQ